MYSRRSWQRAMSAERCQERQNIGMISIKPPDGTLDPRHLRMRAQSRSPKHEQAGRTSLMLRVQEHQKGGHLVRLAVVGTSRIDTTARGSFGNHHIGRRDRTHQLELVVEAG